VNTVRFYLKHEIPDDYNLRIMGIIEAVGGKDRVKKLVSEYEAKYNDIVIDIPCMNAAIDEGGTISYKTMQELCDLKLGLQFLLS
jgi:hypothetical protein